MKVLSVAAAALLLAACGSSSAPTADGAVTPVAEQVMPCLASGCVKTTLATIPDAENILFTPDGRLFVSGGENVYEIHAQGSGYSATPLLDGTCNFTGLAQFGNILYAACYSGELYAAALTATPALASIATLNGLSAANGLAVDAAGQLYVTNGPIGLAPKISRLQRDPANPMQVVAQSDWLTLTPGVDFPNGLQSHGGALYFSESQPSQPGAIRRVAIQPDGSAGPVTTVADVGSVPDDFSFEGEQMLVALYGNGQVALVDTSGNTVAQTPLQTFSFPSQARLGRPPLFAPTDLLVTEKGIIGDNTSPIGNVLSLYRSAR